MTSVSKLDILELYHTYADDGRILPVLEDISLSIQPNEFLSLIGPSGCGKTTLLYAIAGLIRPSRGQILMNGQPVRKPGADRGVVFQEYALLPWKTVLGNVSYGLKLQGFDKPTRYSKALEFIAMMGLHGFENHYPHQLSGGMKQRVAVARTLAAAPEVMLLDEPFAAIDAQTRMTLQEELSDVLQRTTMTAILVTHSVEEAVFLSDRVAVLSRRPGRLKEIVPVDIPRCDRSWDKLMGDEEFTTMRDYVLSSVRSETPAEDETANA